MEIKRRNTPAKEMVLEMLQSAENALSQDMIEKELNGIANRVTVYRILNSFCEDGLVHKVTSDAGKSYFALCKGCQHQKHTHNHIHFQCVKCSKVECLNQKVEVILPKGYSFINMNNLVSGICNNCN